MSTSSQLTEPSSISPASGSLSDDVYETRSTKYGLVVRTGARNSAYPVQTIHGLIKIGSSVGTLKASIQNIERQLSDLMLKTESANKQVDQISLSSNRKEFLKVLPALLRDFQFENNPALVLAAFPSEKIECRGIYDGRSDLARAFDNPPELRDNGFGISVSGYSEIVEGNARQRVAKGYKGARLTISGRLFVVLSADENFLAWFQQRKEGNPLRYLSFVLAEVTYVFAAYLKNIFATQAGPEYFDLAVALRNSFVDGRPPLLGSSRDHNIWGFSNSKPMPAPKPNVLKMVRVAKSMSIERLAFEVRAALYHRFGYGDEAIPYASIEEQGRVTRPEEITNPNKQ